MQLSGVFVVRISIHALRVEGDTTIRAFTVCNFISIHALRVEGDYRYALQLHIQIPISIHALRVEGDLQHKL